ncbi:MAG: TraR/DksA C4-type zinc finger protein [Chloroflexi bacterium]|jgi:RNA polymerase-binding protein DksA|nr:TraR/DksA C4-type zinc finger protein [Chloroflexota bacterium]
MDPAPGLDLAAARAALHAERARLWAELGEEIEAPGQMTYGSQAAAASHVFAQQRDLALREQAERRIHAIDHALARLDAGTYGTCEICGNEIPAERLEVVPWATTCVACSRHK